MDISHVNTTYFKHNCMREWSLNYTVHTAKDFKYDERKTTNQRYPSCVPALVILELGGLGLYKFNFWHKTETSNAYTYKHQIGVCCTDAGIFSPFIHVVSICSMYSVHAMLWNHRRWRRTWRTGFFHFYKQFLSFSFWSILLVFRFSQDSSMVATLSPTAVQTNHVYASIWAQITNL